MNYFFRNSLQSDGVYSIKDLIIVNYVNSCYELIVELYFMI